MMEQHLVYEPVRVRPRSSHISEVLPARETFLTMHGMRYCCQKCMNNDSDSSDHLLSCDKNFCTVCIQMDIYCPLCLQKDSSEIEMSFIENQRVVGEIDKFSNEDCILQGCCSREMDVGDHMETHSKADCSFASIVCSTCKGIVQLDELPDDWDEWSVNCQLYQCESCNQPVPDQEGASLQDEFQPPASFPCPHGCGVHVKRPLKHEESCPNVVKQCSNVEDTTCETEKFFDRDSVLQEVYSSMQKLLEHFEKEMLQTKKELQEVRHEMNAANSVISNLSSELSKTKASNKEMADLLQSELEYFNQPHNSSLKNLSIKCMRVQLALLSDPTGAVLSAKKSLFFRLQNYNEYTKSANPWHSPKFTIRNGYQMCMAVHFNRKDVSINVHLVAGPLDSGLTWPLIFNDTIEVSLLNQQLPESTSKGSPLLGKIRSRSGEEKAYIPKQAVQIATRTLTRVNKPLGEMGSPAFGNIASLCLEKSISLVLVNNSLVFKLELRERVEYSLITGAHV